MALEHHEHALHTGIRRWQDNRTLLREKRPPFQYESAAHQGPDEFATPHVSPGLETDSWLFCRGGSRTAQASHFVTSRPVWRRNSLPTELRLNSILDSPELSLRARCS